MIRCIVWLQGEQLEENLQLLQYHAIMELIDVLGVVFDGEQNNSYLPFNKINKSEITNFDYDCIIVANTTKSIKEIVSETSLLKIDEEKIIPIKAISLPGFNYGSYLKLRKNVPTIISQNCWGGIVYDMLGLPFKSPFINMYESKEDYIKLLSSPKKYMQYPLVFERFEYETNLKRDYPVAKCGDILLHFNHYLTFEEANDCWLRRKERIDWDNLIVVFFEEDPNKINNFLNMPYKNKICLAPFEHPCKDVVAVAHENNNNCFCYYANLKAHDRNFYLYFFNYVVEKGII